MTSALLLLLLCLCHRIVQTSGDIYRFDSTTLIYSEPEIFRAVAMYSDADAPRLFVDEDGTGSYIKLNMSFTPATSSYIPPTDSMIDILLYQATDLNDIGYTDSQGNFVAFCCRPDLRDMTTEAIDGCSDAKQDNQLIVKSTATAAQKYHAVFDGVTNTANLLVSYPITSTGEHIMIVSQCDMDISSPVSASGISYWHNKSGWLIGKLYGFLTFYSVLLGVYCALASIWLALYIKHREYIVTVQHFITWVLLWCIVEVAIQFVDYSEFNKKGIRNQSLLIFGIVLTSLRLTMSRVLVVSVSLGFGSVRSSLGNTKYKLLVIGFIYFACETAMELMERQSSVSKQMERWRVWVAIPVALLNAIFYVWIFSGLNTTIAVLTQKQQHAKLRVYRKFFGVLVFCLIASVLFVFYEFWYLATLQALVNWDLVSATYMSVFLPCIYP
jgi:hypothetical protein